MRRAIAILSAFALAAPILADEIIYMRDGTIVTGRIKFQNPEKVVISTGEGEQTIEKSRIRRIAFASESEKEIAAQIQDLEEKRKACENLEKEMEERCDRRLQEALQAERARAERRARVAAEDYRSRLRSAALWNAVVPGAGYRKLGETNKGFFFTAAAAGSLLYYYQSHRRSVSLRGDYRAMTAFSFAGAAAGSAPAVGLLLAEANQIRQRQNAHARAGNAALALFAGLYAAGIAEPAFGRTAPGDGLFFSYVIRY